MQVAASAPGEPADWLWRLSTGRSLLIALVLCAAITVGFVVWMHTVDLPKDARIGVMERLSVDAIAERLRGLYPRWRRYYLLSTLTLDLLYPVAYALLLSLAIGWLLRTIHPAAPFHSLKLLRFLPFAAAAVDYAENAWILFFVTGRRSAEETAKVLAILTPAKWWLSGLSAGIVALLGLWALAAWGIRRRR